MDLQLTSIAADQTRRFSIAGLRVNGHTQDVVLIVQWTGASKEYQDAIANQAFAKLSDKERAAAVRKLLATHIVVGWDNVPIADGNALEYTATRGEQILSAFDRDGRLDRQNRFMAFVANGDNFQRSLVDADDLGNA